MFNELAVFLGLATIFGYFINLLDLPLLVGYLLVGIAIASFTFFNFNHSQIAILPEFGTAFVLFLTGMELDFREIKSFSKPIIICCLIQSTISALAGYTIASYFGFKGLEAKYLAIGLSFSSTIVVVKLLLEKKDLTSLYGKLSVGILLLEDIVALLILMFLSISGVSVSLSLENGLLISSMAVKGIILVTLSFLASKYLLSYIFKKVSSNPELLFLTALTWCFVSIMLALSFGFSVVIGAFMAGIALAPTPFRYAVSGKIKPMRDFFLVIFFIFLGSQVSLTNALSNIWAIAAFTLYAIMVKPLIFLLLLGSFGFRKHTIFQTAMNLSQISEFSLIIMLTGVQSNIISPGALSIMAFSVTLSIILSSIMIAHSRNIYPLVRPILSFFETKEQFNVLENRLEGEMEDHVVVIGAKRIGRPIVDFLHKEKIPLIVLDFDPEVLGSLDKQGIKSIYGDMADSEILENLFLDKAVLIISTASDVNDNRMLLSQLRQSHSRAKTVIRVNKEEEIEDLKKRGADYCLLPEQVSADFFVEQLKKSWPNINFSLG